MLHQGWGSRPAAHLTEVSRGAPVAEPADGSRHARPAGGAHGAGPRRQRAARPGPAAGARACVRCLRRPVAPRRVGRRSRCCADARREVRGLVAQAEGHELHGRSRASRHPPCARLLGALEARPFAARRPPRRAPAAELPQRRHRKRRPGPVHPPRRARAGDVRRHRLPPLRARDERVLVPVDARRGELRARVAARRRHRPRRGCEERPLRLVGEPEPLRDAGRVPAELPRLLARRRRTSTRSASR